MTRLLGALLLSLGCGGAGLAFRASLQRRKRALSRLTEHLAFMEREILVRCTPLPELMEELSSDGTLFSRPFRLPGSENEFRQRWTAMAAALDAEPGLRRAVSELGAGLSRGADAEQSFACVRGEAERSLARLEEELRDRGRIAPAVSLCAGALLSLALL